TSSDHCVAQYSRFQNDDRARLDAICLIPPKWAQAVQPAFEFWLAHREIFANAKDPAHRKQLLSLIRGDNAVLAFIACRALGRAGFLSLDDVPAVALNARD